MKKNKIIGIALALSLTAIPEIETFVPFAPSSPMIEVSAVMYEGDEYDECMVTTVNDGLNLRKSPDANSKVITTIPRFATVDVKGKVKNGWVKVSYKKNTGYVYAKYLSKISYGESGTYKPGKNVTTGLNLREGPGTEYTVLTSIPKDGKFTTSGIVVNGYLKVKYKGNTGWVSRKYTNHPDFLYGEWYCG